MLVMAMSFTDGGGGKCGGISRVVKTVCHIAEVR